MLAITTPPSGYSDPSSYQLSDVARPVISQPNDVVIQVHAASINPVDVKMAAGMMKRAVKDEFPRKIGYDCAGVVTEVGSDMKRIRVGDEVYTRLPESSLGSWSGYAKCEEHHVALKPTSLSFGDAASLPLASMTALQALTKYKGSLAGKTVFIPAGLSGTGSLACQLAKNVFHAGKVITSVSTGKIEMVPKILGEDVVDQIIDYTKDDPNEVIPPRSVDFILDTIGQAMHFLSLMTPSTGLIVSISLTPSGTQLQESSFMKRPGNPQVPLVARIFLDGMDAIRKLRARRWGVDYEYFFLQSSAEELEKVTTFIEEGKLVPVVGSRTDLRDLEKVREACELVRKGKGGIGKAVFNVISS